MADLKPGKYKHYKWKLYEVIWVARHTETYEELVVYRALYESKEFGDYALWVRPKAIFMEIVLFGGVEVKRFEYIGE